MWEVSVMLCLFTPGDVVSLAFSCFSRWLPSHVCLMGKAVGYSVVEDPVGGSHTAELTRLMVLTSSSNNTQGPLLSRSVLFDY